MTSPVVSSFFALTFLVASVAAGDAPDFNREIRPILDPAAEAEADTIKLLRRVTFDLTGLPPTPAEVEAFLADTRPEAYAALVDKLLASPRHAERMAAWWLDLVRYADTVGYQPTMPRPIATG